MDILVEPAPRKYAHPPNFGAEVTGTKLRVPENIADALKTLRLHTAIEFVSFLQAYPTAVAKALDWKLAEVVQARDTLIKDLRGVLPDGFLETPRRRVVYGAVDPSTARRKAR